MSRALLASTVLLAAASHAFAQCQPPDINGPYPGQQVAFVGQSPTFDVGWYQDAATCVPTAVQWYFEGTAIPGATNFVSESEFSYTITNAQLTNAGHYWPVFTFSFGTMTSSNAAILQVLPTNAPSISVDGQLAVGSVTNIGFAQVSMAGGFSGGFIFYTLDGSTPTSSSAMYNGAFNITTSAVVNAMSMSSDFAHTAYAPAVSVKIISGFPLTVTTPGGGTVTVNGQVIPPQTFFTNGSMVTLAASPASGWSFLGWQGDVTSTNNPLNLTINKTNNVQGIFGTIVGTSVSGLGTILLSPTNPVPYGTTVTATAVPSPGNHFVVWSGAVSGTHNPTNFVVTSATPTVGALFSDVPVSITITRSGTNLSLSWPSSYTGWTLESQNKGITMNWSRIGSSSTTNQVIVPIGPTNRSTFFRLIYP